MLFKLRFKDDQQVRVVINNSTKKDIITSMPLAFSIEGEPNNIPKKRPDFLTSFLAVTAAI
jgi:hypothetical protein